MKKTDRNLHNGCFAAGQVVNLEKLYEPGEAEDYLLILESILPDGKKVQIPCAVSKTDLDTCGGTVREGDWVSVFGIVTGGYSEKEDLGCVWIETITLKRETRRSRKKYTNEAVLTGTSIEGGCLIDRGEPVSADFVLELESLSGEETFEVDAVVPKKAVRDYINTLGCRKLRVLGAMEFYPSEDDTTVGMLLHVKKIIGEEAEA